MRFYGQNLQDKFIFERYFLNRKDGLSIECGSFDGITESSTKFFEEHLGWKTINIEAYPEIFQSLKKNRPNSINLSLALSDTKEKRIFKHAVHPVLGKKFGNGSLNHSEEHKKELLGNNCSFIDFEVECDTYTNVIDGIITDNLGSQKVDLFVLDVEGYELEVINGMKNSKFLPEVFCIEYPIVGLDRLNKSLESLNYKLDTTYNNNAYFLKK